MKTEMFCRFVNILNASGIRYALLGNTESYPEKIGGDVDTMVHPDDWTKLHEALWLMEDAGTRVVNRVRRGRAAFCYTIAHVSPDGAVAMLKPDVFTDYAEDCDIYMGASGTLENAVPAEYSDGRQKGFNVLAPHMEFAYYLLKKIHKSAVDEAQFAYLAMMFGKAPGACAKEIARYCGAADAAKIRGAFECGNYAGFSGMFPGLRERVFKIPGVFSAKQLKNLRWIADRVFTPVGFAISTSGDAGIVAKDWAETQRATFVSRCPRFSPLMGKIKSMLFVCNAKCLFADVVVDGESRPETNRKILEAMSRRATKRWKPEK